MFYGNLQIFRFSVVAPIIQNDTLHALAKIIQKC